MREQQLEVAVIGGGIMGADVMALFGASGCTVHAVVRPGANQDSLPRRFAHAVEQLGVPPDSAKLRIASQLHEVDWPSVGLVIECVNEDLALKRSLFAQLEQLAAPDIPLTSNSSGFPISEIGAGLRTQWRMLGLHFFMPAHLIPLVEVVCSEHTRPSVGQAVFDLMKDLGRRPVMVKQDIPGFLANRLQHALMREAWSLIERGVASPEDVDTAVRYGFGFRYIAAGPILQKELSGLDVHYASSKTMYPDLCNHSAPIAALAEKVRDGHLGVKTGKGFYAWTPDRIASEKARYERALRSALEILNSEEA